MEKLKIEAKTTQNTTRQIISNAASELDKPTLATVASQKSLSKMIGRLRNKDTHPMNPRDVSELILPEEYRTTIKGENFLLYDSSTDHGDDNRFLIFGTIANLKFLARCESMYMDGTFSIVPVIFKQLYTIHGMSIQITEAY